MSKRSFRAEREFGLIVGGILVLLSAWWFYRGKFGTLREVTLPLGAVLVLAGIVVPKALVLPNKGWMAVAQLLSFISTRIILAIVYFLVQTPIGVTKRLMGWDPLHRREAARETYWRP